MLEGSITTGSISTNSESLSLARIFVCGLRIHIRLAHILSLFLLHFHTLLYTHTHTFILSLPPSPSHPGYFGKVGMRHFHLTRNKYYQPTVNLDKIWSLVSEQTRVAYKDRTDKAPVIDVVRAVSLLPQTILFYLPTPSSHMLSLPPSLSRVITRFWARECYQSSQ